MAGQKPTHTANDFDPEVLRLFDKYVHGGLDRRSTSGSKSFAVWVGFWPAIGGRRSGSEGGVAADAS